jgi:hypothetical protein
MAKPTELNPKWVLPILLVVLVVLVTLHTMLAPNQPNNPEEPLANRSIYNSAPTGYRAWYLASKKAGLPLLVWERSFSHLNELPSPSTMLIVEPYAVDKNSIIFGDKEVARLMYWVQQGNTLVLLDNFNRYGSSYVVNTLALRLAPGTDTPNTLPRTLSLPQKTILASFIHRPLYSGSTLAFQHDPQALKTPLSGLPDILLDSPTHQPMMIRLPYGDGAVILGTTGDLGANRFLHSPANDNYQFLANLLLQEQKPVYINEFIHGYVEASDLLSYYQKQTPLGPIFGQLFLAFLVLLWLSFVRWTPKPAETEESLAMDTGSGLDAYIQSLAGIYLRTNAATLAITPLLHRIDALLQRKYRLPAGPDMEGSADADVRLRDLLGTVLGAYSNKDEAAEPITVESAMDALRKARTVSRTQQRLQPRELLRLAQQLTSIEERFQQYGQRHPALRR